MEKRLSFEGSNRFAVRRSAGEEQCRSGGGVIPKEREHRALIVARQVEEAVPSQDTVKLTSQGERTHIADVPSRLWKAGSTQAYQGWRGIQPGHVETAREQISRDRPARTAAEIEDESALGQKSRKAINPGHLKIIARAPPFVPRVRVPLVEINDSLGERRHARARGQTSTGCSTRPSTPNTRR